MAAQRLKLLLQDLVDRALAFAEERGTTVRRVVPQWLSRLATVGIAALIILLLLGGGDVVGSVAKSLLTALVVGGAAYVWFYSWTSERATRRVRADARRRPELLFPTPPRIGSASWVRGRDDLIDDICVSLGRRFGSGPHLIVGNTGSGKTTLLLGLADRLANVYDVLPIVLSLRGRDEIDFAELAKERFRESLDPYLRSGDEAEKLWRWMYRGNRIAILADDLDRGELDKGRPDPHKSAARAAIESARRRQLPLVITSRHEGVPPDLVNPPIELPPLELTPDQARDYVLERAGKHAPKDVDLVDEHIENGNLLNSPFYLEILARLARSELLPEVPDSVSEHRVRTALLRAWRASLLGDRAVPVEQKQDRAAVLERLDAIAASTLEPTASIDPRPELLNDLRAGQLLGVVEIDEGGAYRFTHEIVHAYSAAQILCDDEKSWRAAIAAAGDASRVQLALVLAAADSESEQFAEAVCHALLAEAPRMPDQQRLLRATAASAVARAAGSEDPQLADWLSSVAVSALPAAAPVAKRAALEQLAGLPGKSVIEALWGYANDVDYGVRWRAAERLADRCSRTGGPPPSGADAYEVLAPKCEMALARAERCLNLPPDRRPDDWDPEILPLKHMGWMLPALATAARETPAADRVQQHLRKLLELYRRGVTAQRGLEASIAQGFKLDARLQPSAEVSRDAAEMLGQAKFWYSRMNLLQAIAVRVIRSGGTGPGLAELEGWAETEEHPFARAAARLCLTAAGKAADGRLKEAMQHVWDDEGVVVSARPRDLAPEAIQLVGDITVLLNLNETGTVDQREQFGMRNDVPFCISESTDRGELFAASPCSCDFHLCPFRQAPGASAHRELSRAFCNHQRLYADSRVARRWGSNVRRRELRAFWSELEALART